MNPITMFLTFVAVLIGLLLLAVRMPVAAAACFVLAVLVFASLKMANAWERFVILRAGRLHGVKGPGLFWIVPVLDSITAIVDQRIQTTAFSAEQALTRDTVPVNVEAVVFWHVHDAQKAALNITNYREAVDRVSQTSLREMIGASMLAALLSERQAADEFLRAEIARQPGAIPVPGGTAGSFFWNGLGFLTTAVAIVLALIPPADSKDKVGFFVQVFIGSFGFLAAGIVLYALAERRRRRTESSAAA